MNALVELDEQSRLAVLEPGSRLAQAEALLRARFTIGHFPPRVVQYLTLGGAAAAARSSGQGLRRLRAVRRSRAGLRVAPAGHARVRPGIEESAAGPDLRQLIPRLRRGTLGVITSLTVALPGGAGAAGI
jgi:alkyldihydroxyacetonephosphate synthase